MGQKKQQETSQVKAGKARMASMTEKERERLASRAGRVGGKARAKVLSAEERKAIARKAAAARWSKSR